MYAANMVNILQNYINRVSVAVYSVVEFCLSIAVSKIHFRYTVHNI